MLELVFLFTATVLIVMHEINVREQKEVKCPPHSWSKNFLTGHLECTKCGYKNV